MTVWWMSPFLPSERYKELVVAPAKIMLSTIFCSYLHTQKPILSGQNIIKVWCCWQRVGLLGQLSCWRRCSAFWVVRALAQGRHTAQVLKLDSLKQLINDAPRLNRGNVLKILPTVLEVTRSFDPFVTLHLHLLLPAGAFLPGWKLGWI